jgi:hypothetical protein
MKNIFEARDEILKIVDSKQGCKATELVAAFAILHPDYEGDVLNDIEGLINEKKLIEVEYILPNMDYRVKSMLFPAKTRVIRVRGRHG